MTSDANKPILPITSITIFSLRIPRDFTRGIGGAGSPVVLSPGAVRYRAPASYATVYSSEIESLLVKVVAGDITGWGEAQTPIAPEICHSILEHLVGPMLIGQNALSPAQIHSTFYDAMRVRGHSGGFYLDALAAVDIALWDICGRFSGLPVYALLGGAKRSSVPLYVSGLIGPTPDAQVEYALRAAAEGAQAFKVFWPESPEAGLDLVRRLRKELPPSICLYVDALWRMTLSEASYYADALGDLRVGWLEAPLMPEDMRSHAALRAKSRVPIAIGESYRSRYDFLRILEANAADVLQPDLGRTGITTANHIAELALTHNLAFAPHVSISMGPQIAAALHVSATARTLLRMETNPQILAIAQRFLEKPLSGNQSEFDLPAVPGLGIDLKEELLQPYQVKVTTIHN
jgi:galactonate dehydratase